MTLEFVDGELIATPTELVLEDVVSLNAQITFDCCKLIYYMDETVPVEGDSLSFSYLINPDGEDFRDGIYQVKLVGTYENGTTISETLCIFADSLIGCAVAEYVSKNRESDAGWIYYLLTKTDTCACNCGASCELMKMLRSILGHGVCRDCDAQLKNTIGVVNPLTTTLPGCFVGNDEAIFNGVEVGDPYFLCLNNEYGMPEGTVLVVV